MLTSFDGVPDAKTTEAVYDNLDFQRATQAYLSTLQRFRQLRHRLAGDLREHHWHLDLAPAQQVADRLERSAHLSFADFLL